MAKRSLPKKCPVPNCDREQFAWGYCNPHYLRLKRHGSTDARPSRSARVGQKFGRLTLIKEAPKLPSNAGRRWLCRCDCGRTREASQTNLRRGLVKSCGCLVVDALRSRATHGLSNTKEYDAWKSMLRRCYDPRTERYPVYGGRGIRVCERWRDGFENFLADIGFAPSQSHSIDRIDVNGDYEPQNCRWATPKEQSRNTSRNIRLTLNGQTKTLAEWAEGSQLRYRTIHRRVMEQGWSLQDALTRSSSRRKPCTKK